MEFVDALVQIGYKECFMLAFKIIATITWAKAIAETLNEIMADILRWISEKL